MKTDQLIRMLTISAQIMGRVEVIHPTLAWDTESVLLVDAGFPGQLALVREAVANRAIGRMDRLREILRGR